MSQDCTTSVRPTTDSLTLQWSWWVNVKFAVYLNEACIDMFFYYRERWSLHLPRNPLPDCWSMLSDATCGCRITRGNYFQCCVANECSLPRPQLIFHNGFRACEALCQCLPDQLKDDTFAACLKDDKSTKHWLAQLLKNLQNLASGQGHQQPSVSEAGGMPLKPTVKNLPGAL